MTPLKLNIENTQAPTSSPMEDQEQSVEDLSHISMGELAQEESNDEGST